MNELGTRFSLGGTGASIANKDSIDIAGYPTIAGSRALADASPATCHAQVIELLLQANWHIVGKANMHELAFGMTGINDYTGTPTNPQDASRIPGGSSSGSAAAVGAQLVDAALGTDTGGSVRGPAACCGVIGFKPTYGRVSRVGVAPRHSTLDCVGPFAREMQMIVQVMSAIAPGFDANAASTSMLRGVKLGLLDVDADPSIQAAVNRAADESGFACSRLVLPGLKTAFDAGLTIINAETWAAFGSLTGHNRLGADIEARLCAAAATNETQLAAAEQVRSSFTHSVEQLLRDVDVLVLPTLPNLPITLEAARAGTSVIGLSSLIRPFNLSGHPALTLPVSVQGSPLKAGLQIVGRKGEDEHVCAIAGAFERAIAAISA